MGQAWASPGSTIPRQLEEAIQVAQAYDPKIIVEQGFVGVRELECGVLADLDGGRPLASVVAEIRVHSKSGFYDFEAKYLPEEQVDLDVPATVRPELASQVQELAVRTFEAIGCEGLARVDMFVTHEGQVVINEINTMPGFTEHSMFPRMWAGQRSALSGTGRAVDHVGARSTSWVALTAASVGYCASSSKTRCGRQGRSRCE